MMTSPLMAVHWREHTELWEVGKEKSDTKTAKFGSYIELYMHMLKMALSHNEKD